MCPAAGQGASVSSSLAASRPWRAWGSPGSNVRRVPASHSTVSPEASTATRPEITCTTARSRTRCSGSCRDRLRPPRLGGPQPVRLRRQRHADPGKRQPGAHDHGARLPLGGAAHQQACPEAPEPRLTKRRRAMTSGFPLWPRDVERIREKGSRWSSLGGFRARSTRDRECEIRRDGRIWFAQSLGR